MYKNLKERCKLLKQLRHYLITNREKSEPVEMFEMFMKANLSDDMRERAILSIIIDFDGHRDWKVSCDDLETELLLVDEAYYKLSH